MHQENLQIFPIESVYGIIEVKSSLSKDELLDSLEKIKTLKSLVPRESIQIKGPIFETAYPRPMPFGIVFSYSL